MSNHVARPENGLTTYMNVYIKWRKNMALRMFMRRQDNGKWCLIGDVPIGNTGEWETRTLATNLSKIKAEKLKQKYNKA
jgi:hypothetical protein